MSDTTEQTQETDVEAQGTDAAAGNEDVKPESTDASTDSQPEANAFEQGVKQVFGEEMDAEAAIKKLQNLNSLVGDQTVAAARKKADTYDNLIERASTEQGVSKEEVQARIEEALTAQAGQTAPAATVQAQPTAPANTGDALLRKQVADLTRSNQTSQLLTKYPEAQQILETVQGDWDASGPDMTQIFEAKYKPLLDAGTKNADEVTKEKESQTQPSSNRIDSPETKARPKNWQEALEQRVTDKLFGDGK